MSTETTVRDWLDRLAAIIAEHRIAGGCDDCGAFQRVIRDEDDIFTIRTFHDDGCLFLAGVTR